MLGALLTPEDLAKRTPFKRATWRLWFRQGRLPSFALGRHVFTREEDVTAFLAQHVRGASAQTAGELVARTLRPAAPKNGGATRLRAKRRAR